MTWTRITFVTGTDTDVGKTIATAALAVALAAGGNTVAVYKPTQTGVLASGHGDMGEVTRLSGNTDVHEGIRLTDPMAPTEAAFREQRQLPSLQAHVQKILALAATRDHVVVEGAGGLLVELDGAGNTLANLAAALGGTASTCVVLVCRSGLGTLNHTQLTLEALHHRALPTPKLLIGSWPAAPSDVDLSNRQRLETREADFIGALPEGAAALSPDTFRRLAPEWLDT